MANGKNRIVVTELPFMVNKARLIEKIAELAKDKRIDGITHIADESSREGMRINIELRKDVNPNVILNQLYKHTQLQDTFGVIMLALVNNEPRVLNLLDMLKYYLRHQEDVVTRRTKYELNKAEERAHILKGLLIALDNIDRVIEIIRGSANVQDAKASLIEEFALDDVQAQAIVDMRLRALTGLERDKIEKEYAELMARIEYLKEILADEKKLLGVIKEEITLISDKYGDDRINMEDLIPVSDTVITMTHLGYIKRMTPDNFRSQNRGGKGIKGMQTLDEDFIEEIFMSTTHNYLMFFTSFGRVYRMKAYEIPEAGRTARGTAIINLLHLQPGEKISAVIPIKEWNDDAYLVMATKNGVIKKTPMSDYNNIRKTGLQAIVLRDDDELIEVKVTDGERKIILVTENGMSICFDEKDIRITGRVSMGVIGIKLDEGDEVVAMQLDIQGEYLLIVSENGLGKRTLISEFHPQNRNGKGLKCYKITEKTGKVIGAKAVNEDDEIMMITNEGIVIRTDCASISVLKRITSGVKLMHVDSENGIKVANIAKVREQVRADQEDQEEQVESDEENPSDGM